MCLSNFAGFWFSYTAASPILTQSVLSVSKLTPNKLLSPSFEFSLPNIIKNDYALLGAICIAFVNNFIKSKLINNLGMKASICANFLLKKIICPILPVFVLGFIIKMQHEGTLTLIVKEYSLVIMLAGILTYGYIATLLLLL